MTHSLYPARSHLVAAARHLWQVSREAPPSREMREAAEHIQRAAELLKRSAEREETPHYSSR